MFFTVDYASNNIYSETIHKFKYTYVPDARIFPNEYRDYWEKFSSQEINGFSRCSFRRINAERDVIAELESDSEDLGFSGEGASNLVRKFINFSEYDEKLIEITLLNALNQILYPDAQFTEIKIQQVDIDESLFWEIFLQEGENRYALSKMGSGLKTVILVLLNLLVVPKLKAYENKEIIYAFEELENNLHPALQRRLFDYLYEYSIKNDCTVFLTTHSHVAINVFSDKDNAQLFHVVKKNGSSTLSKIDDYMAKSSLLNDLDVRASDLLQSNGIIWVEGPSDRVYIKRWLEIFGREDYIEGRDYQFLYYGGRLLAHYTIEQKKRDLINILLTNRNAIIVIDSDKRNKQAHINDTKKRIQDEFGKYNALCWITKGKEIENYVSKEAIEKAFGKSLKLQCSQYELFPKYIQDICPSFIGEKIMFAKKVCEYLTSENSAEIMDLKTQVLAICDTIKSWNKKYDYYE